VSREAASRYYRMASAVELIDILSKARDMAIEVESVASRRFTLGDVAILDVNVARATRARAEADVSAARADLARERGELAGLLNWPEVAALTIEPPVVAPRDIDIESLARGLATRPDLAAIEALERSAEAEQRLAMGSRRPEFGLSFDVDREEGATALIGGFVVRLPVFQRGDGQAAAAAARRARLRLERAAARVAAETALTAAAAAYRNQAAALRVLETDALPATVENEHLARRSYEAGQISLAEWLLYRRESLDTVREYVERKLTCALALVEIDAIAGVLR
jgi:outer membrane protein, heavy metal efflux system